VAVLLCELNFMEGFILFAKPWWINFLVLTPFISYFLWKKGLGISWKTLFLTGIFGIAFGFVEAAVVVYLRSATGFLTLKNGMLLNTFNFQSFYQKPEIADHLPAFLFSIELYREAATVVMLLAITFIAASFWRDRIAIFLWVFAFWDIFYYVFLWLTIRWPASLTDQDILFFIPTPWLAQVWYPILISALFILAIILRKKNIEQV
jgi:hypothetical protein